MSEQSTKPEPVSEPTCRARVTPWPDATIETVGWDGHLVWMVSGALGNSDHMTVGRCYIQPGGANPRHYHPNCDEVLHLIQGCLRHTAGDEVVEMTPGDTISIPANVVHNATNIGEGEAIMVISFSSADRQTVGE